jgi:SAM-dependent methyltransferase
MGDATTLNLDERFDAVLMMFAVLGYQVANADVQAALSTVRRHLQPGGLFIADVWYGPAVLTQRPGDRVRVIDLANDERILRAASTAMDTRAHVCEVGYHVWRLGNGRVLDETREQHRMRYFFPLELELLLAAARFDLLRLCAFPDLDVDPDETTWNVLFVARAT